MRISGCGTKFQQIQPPSGNPACPAGRCPAAKPRRAASGRWRRSLTCLALTQTRCNRETSRHASQTRDRCATGVVTRELARGSHLVPPMFRDSYLGGVSKKVSVFGQRVSGNGHFFIFHPLLLLANALFRFGTFSANAICWFCSYKDCSKIVSFRNPKPATLCCATISKSQSAHC